MLKRLRNRGSNVNDSTCICEKCGSVVNLKNPFYKEFSECENCGQLYNDNGKALLNVTDTFKEQAKPKRIKAIKGKKVEDSRDYINEYNEEYYERYRGITIYRVQLSEYEYRYEAEYLGEKYTAPIAKDLREKLDEAITKDVEKYSKQLTFKNNTKVGIE